MSKIAQINVDGIDYAVSGASLTGTCSSPASDFMKLVTLTDSDSIEDGVTIACTFVHENSAGTAPASLTLYSTDQIHFYTDAGMTEPYVLAPSGCFELTYTGSGNAYSYISYPVVAVGTLSGIVSAPVCDSHGKVTSRSLWKAGDVVFLQYKSRKFFVMNDGSGNSTAGVAFKGTRSAYETAKLILEGSDGHIPSGALVIITDEGKTYVTNGTGSSQTLELVANATFNGSHAEWNALTLAQKAMYNIVNFTDDEGIGLTISDAVEDGNMNPVTSNAVYDEMVLHLSRKGYRCSSNFSSVSWVNVKNIGVLNEGNYVVVWSQGTNIGAISIQTARISFLSSNINQRLGFITIPEGGSVNPVNIVLYPNSTGKGSIDVLITKLDFLI